MEVIKWIYITNLYITVACIIASRLNIKFYWTARRLMLIVYCSYVSFSDTFAKLQKASLNTRPARQWCRTLTALGLFTLCFGNSLTTHTELSCNCTYKIHYVFFSLYRWGQFISNSGRANIKTEDTVISASLLFCIGAGHNRHICSACCKCFVSAVSRRTVCSRKSGETKRNMPSFARLIECLHNGDAQIVTYLFVPLSWSNFRTSRNIPLWSGGRGAGCITYVALLHLNLKFIKQMHYPPEDLYYI